MSEPAFAADAPMRLEEAVEALRGRYPVTVAMLRTEIRKGRLTPAKVAGKFFVTESQIRDMFKPCPVARKAPASTSAKADATAAAAPPSPTSGLSVIGTMSGQQAALRVALETLRGNLPSTSPGSGRRKTDKPSATVVTLHK